MKKNEREYPTLPYTVHPILNGLATALNFLHRTCSFVHPATSDRTFVCKISDVGLSRLCQIRGLLVRGHAAASPHVETAIESGQLANVLDRTVGDLALSLAKLALKYCELRRREEDEGRGIGSVVCGELFRCTLAGSLEVTQRSSGSEPTTSLTYRMKHALMSVQSTAPIVSDDHEKGALLNHDSFNYLKQKLFGK
ncbi:protein kinase family protein [Striga asiatica]|uniref:RING-type E3 ubiquitin transferase n=1 Tax=Striga asiatica TaxID=4170 RepID=A0A5A7RG14_STRAF|nr:protein kinase family protein [Striga asiatica]